MTDRWKARCERVRKNNGIIEVFLKANEPPTQEQTFLMNVVVPHKRYEEGQYYWIEIQPAFPH